MVGNRFLKVLLTLNVRETLEKKKVMSVAQDIVFGVSDGKNWTPKHIGLLSMDELCRYFLPLDLRISLLIIYTLVIGYWTAKKHSIQLK